MVTSCGASGFGISIAGFRVGVKFGLDDFTTMGEINMRNSVSFWFFLKSGKILLTKL